LALIPFQLITGLPCISPTLAKISNTKTITIINNNIIIMTNQLMLVFNVPLTSEVIESVVVALDDEEDVEVVFADSEACGDDEEPAAPELEAAAGRSELFKCFS
jgi:hypothetical protein